MINHVRLKWLRCKLAILDSAVHGMRVRRVGGGTGSCTGRSTVRLRCETLLKRDKLTNSNSREPSSGRHGLVATHLLLVTSAALRASFVPVNGFRDSALLAAPRSGSFYSCFLFPQSARLSTGLTGGVYILLR